MQFESSKNEKLLNLAKTEIEKALEYSPNELWVNVYAAFIYYDLKDKVKATKSIDKVINSNYKGDWVKNLKAEIEAIK
jgi:Tfp pilus assembly protein PilF